MAMKATAKDLIAKYCNGTLTDEEKLQLLRITDNVSDEAMQELFREMTEEPVSPVDSNRLRLSLEKVLAVDKDLALPESRSDLARTRRIWGLGTAWVRYAAAIVLIAGAAIYLWSGKDRSPAKETVIAQPVKDIAPGGQKAVLTLADGTAITLDSSNNGQLAIQQGSQIQNSNGQVIYAPSNNKQAAPAFNTLRTPRGGTYRLTLSDGTTVWLNAASSISYPVTFSGRERLVEMSGEVYFDIAPHAKMPFKVKINDKNIVEVLGTQFNVKAYAEDEVVNTTLMQGAVRVTGNGQQVTLKPGQQAQAFAQQLSVKKLDQKGLAQAIAWKEGRFNFQDVNLQEIMRQLARWYDLEVVYENGVPNLDFIGEIERSLPLSEVLKGLKMSGVNFRLDGKRLIIFP
ncbi:FecR family protein [Pseudoflavitalea rhizosphaerae]|uniref:FecR family protein n=1 Tax=Pseudoflavitalea rhizosphaerae TaxID=1884793 RepID=UPI000F8E4823|nr:FecR domain-containing protein [Pseudoflavitalea rhizosphaerae]